MTNLQRFNWLGQECRHLEHVFIDNHCYFGQVRASMLDPHLINLLLQNQPESCHGINFVMSRYQLDAWSPWKFSSTARFCFLFLFSDMSSSTGTNLIDAMASTFRINLATVISYGPYVLRRFLFMASSAYTLSHAHLSIYTYILQSITYVADYERSGLRLTESPSLLSVQRRSSN